MKKISFILLIVLAVISCNKPSNSNQDTTATIQNEGDAVEVIYFHGKQRCATCNAIEREAQQLVDSAFSEELADGKLVFKVVDFSQKENESLAEKYEVAWSSLFVNDYINGEKITNNMTEFAFANARSNPDVFKSELKRIIAESLVN